MREYLTRSFAGSETRSDRQPLFVTRLGLSDRTAIGVQTRQLVKYFPNSTHLYWHECLFDPRFPHSHRIENWLFGRVPVLKHDNVITQALSGLNASLWRSDKPAPALSAFLRRLRRKASVLYLAPIEGADARRMKEIAEELQLPFVLHIWDFLDDNVAETATHWLIDHAEHVFCLSRQMLEDIQGIQSRSSILTFSREPSKCVATYPVGSEIRIALLGNVAAYSDGVTCLVRAVEALRARGKNYRIIYVGPRKSLRRSGLETCAFITATGFLATTEELDAAMAGCAIGFVPGPTAPPESDARSKYSIPSRTLDYLAVGLPIVGTVHPGSATFAFCRDLGIDVGLVPTGPERIAVALARLEGAREWRAASARSRAAFARCIEAHDVERFKAILARKGGAARG